MSEPRRWWISDNHGNRIKPDDGIKHLYIEVIEAEPILARIKQLETQLKEANEVAKFYADEYIYDAYDNNGCGDISKATDDYGTKARAYLEKWKGEK